MKHFSFLRIIGLVIAVSVLWAYPLNAQKKSSYHLLWQIGKPDGNFSEFGLAPDGYREYKADGFFMIGKSVESRDWPYVHPGPNDSWAGSRPHDFRILFRLGKLAAGDSCSFRIDFADTHGSIAPVLEISINGADFPAKLPAGGGDESIYGDPSKGKPFTIDIPFPSALLKEGINTISIKSKSGSWFLYDALSLQVPKGVRLKSAGDFLMISAMKAGNALYGKEGDYRQDITMSVINTGKPFKGDVSADGVVLKQVDFLNGYQEIQLSLTEVRNTKTVSVEIAQGTRKMASDKVDVKPVKKMTVYILPHSHTDIGYTEIQTAIEDKQVDNLKQGIAYARQTAGYPEGARFIWNVEVGWAADLYLQRMGEKERMEFRNAVKQGSVALNGMYLNELTGLCRPEELIRLFKYSTELESQTGQKVDAAMISDVPGYTWGTVTAMALAGIKYFSVAPNYFDRIGDILVKWENKPFYWASPSGKEKVLVWIPLKGYAMSHIVRKLSPGWVDDYTGQLEKMAYPYDIAHIRWSGHGDNAVPDPSICEFVKDWNTRYAWPRFIISSTSEAFSQFEKKYGDQLPVERGDWTPYWEDGAGSSALETALNRNTADRLSQAEVLWALDAPGSYPVGKFEEAWKKVLLYSEHTWGAWCSITDPENKMTVEQWEIKKGYAEEAARRAGELLGERTGELGQDERLKIKDAGWEVVNTNSWRRSELVFLSREQSMPGDRVVDGSGRILNSQRLAGGELAFMCPGVDPYSAFRFSVTPGNANSAGSVDVSGNIISNNLIECEIDGEKGDIIRLVDKRTGKNMVDTGGGKAANQYLFFEGNDVSALESSGPVTITIKENGPMVGAIEVVSGAPGCHQLTRQLWLAHDAGYLIIINTVDKKRAPMPEKIGDWYLAQNKNKESVNFAFPFNVPDGIMRLDLPLGQMIPWADQIPSACKNWFTAGRWADVSNAGSGITWVTLDAPLVEVGEISANLVGSQNDPEVWRKSVAPTQTLYSWVMNNHWGTNYRQYQEGPVEFRYILRPHGAFDATEATRFATGFSQPLIIRTASAKPVHPPFTLESKSVTVIAFKPADDGKGYVATLYNPGSSAAKFTLKPASGSPVWQSNTGEIKLREIPADFELTGQEVMTVRF